jgi:hypothetical protein
VSCEHCDVVRRTQAKLAWSGALTGSTPLPRRYYPTGYVPGTYDDRPGYDGDPGPCYCPCHDVWRLWQHMIGSAR